MALDLSALRRIIADENRLLTGADIPAEYQSDVLGRVHGSAEALAFPLSTEEVSALLRYAHEHRVPVTPRGAGTNLVGSTVPLEGGIILDQLPEGGVEVKPGRTVYITINSFRQKMVPVPYVAGRSLRQAKNMLEIAGLEIAELVYRADMATNYVLEEYCEGKPVTPTTRMEAEMGSGVTLYVGVEEGYGTTIVPRLVGLPLAQAKGRLWELGLNVGRVDFDEGVNLLNQKDTRVYIQTPGAERSAALGSKVDLRLTLDEKKLARYRAEAEKQAAVAAEERRAEEQQRADSLARTVLEEASAEPAEERPANNNEGFFD